MSAADAIGCALSLICALAICLIARRQESSSLMKGVVTVGVAARVAGAIGYLLLVNAVYGRGDYQFYHETAAQYADRLWLFDFGMFVDSDEWLLGQWWGTQFVFFPAAFALMFFGPHVLGAFVAFSLLAFGGLWSIVKAWREALPGVEAHRFALAVFLFPSLCFWPSALGKDALLLCGLGVSTLGFVRLRSVANVGAWFLTAAGIALVFAIRPQVAAVVMLAMVMSQWFVGAKAWTPGRIVAALLFSAVALAAIRLSLGTAGVAEKGYEGVTDYIDRKATSAADSGSIVSGPGSGPLGPFIALFSILFRPLPWEITSVTTLLAGAEVIGIWALAWIKRKSLMASLREARRNRLLAFSVIFTLGYSVSLGLVVVNMGIIARQRIFIFPFLLLLLLAHERVPRLVATRERAAPPPRPMAEPAPFRPRRGRPRVPQEA